MPYREPGKQREERKEQGVKKDEPGQPDLEWGNEIKCRRCHTAWNVSMQMGENSTWGNWCGTCEESCIVLDNKNKAKELGLMRQMVSQVTNVAITMNKSMLVQNLERMLQETTDEAG